MKNYLLSASIANGLALKNERAGSSFYRLAFLLLAWVIPVPAVLADDYDLMREKHYTLLTGGASINIGDPDIAAKIDFIENRANSLWNSMDKSSERAYLWSGYTDKNSGSNVNETYNRLREMAVAYATTGSSLEGNATLKTDIVQAMDWLYANWYNETRPYTGNWYEWELSIPFSLNDLMVLMYGDLTATQINNYVKAIDRSSPDPTRYSYNAGTSTGANRVWKCKVVLLRGVVGKSQCKVESAQTALSPVFDYVTSGDGFYADGSFVQHGKYAYTGGYGTTMISTLPEIMEVLKGSPWQVTNNNVYKWVFDSFESVLYKGGLMAMLEGREIARSGAEEHKKGHNVIDAVVFLSQSAPTTSIGSGYPANPALALKRMVKYWVQADNFRTYTPSTIYKLVRYKAIMADASITPRGELVKHKRFYAMDRVVHLRPGFGLGLSLHSSRIYNYESINNENTRGWHTGDGMTYLYNNDLGQFSDNYWPTVDAYRLPGTTVLQSTTASPGRTSDDPWVGGVAIGGIYGVTGMRLHVGNLYARKSWFMFDDEVVALGAGISTVDAKVVETVVENRKINSSGNNTLTVNGTAKSTSIGWSETMTEVKWAHLAGTVAGADIGYFFPVATTVKAVREARTGKWLDINQNSGVDATSYTRNYLTLWLDHGITPTNQTYGYVLLPGKSSSQVSSYAAAPHVSILKNTSEVQAVKENTLNLIAANFWQDAVATVDVGTNYPAFITCNKRASMMVDENSEDIEIAVADPTQQNTGTIEIEVNKQAYSTISKNARITVLQLSPTIKLSVNVNASGGKTYRAKFSLTSPVRQSLDDSLSGEADNAVTISPNPVKGEFTLTFPATSIQPAKLRIVDSQGDVVKQITVVPVTKGINHLKVNASDWSSGLYVIHITLPEGTISRKVIIQK